MHRHGYAIAFSIVLCAVSACATTDNPATLHRSEITAESPIAQQLPARLGLSVDHTQLPNATIPHLGSVRALVLPVSFGKRLPVWSDSAIAYRVIGSHYPNHLRGSAGFLAQMSRGRFRLDATVFPYLIEPHTPPELIGDAALSPHAIRPFAEAVLRAWAKRANLAAYDNDGPDGHPMSGDDDGILDLPIVVVETDSTPALAHVPMKLTIPVGKDGRLSLQVGTVHVIALPRTGVISEDNRGFTTLILGAMGLNPEEMYFPDDWDVPLSTLARVRLSWTPSFWAGRSDRYTVPDGTVLVVPIVDVPDNRGLWLIERHGASAYLTRVARKNDGHFAVVDLRKFEPGESHLDLPLTRTGAEEDPRAQITWSSADDALEVDVRLTKNRRIQ